MIEIIALFALSLVIWGDFRGKRRVLVAYLGGCCLAGLAMSGSRGGYLSFIAGTISFVASASGLADRYSRGALWPQRSRSLPD